MPDCIIMRRGSRQTVTYYIWNRYSVATQTTYYWNRYNRVSTTTYRWNRYNVNSTTIYNWNRYNIIQNTVYKYNKYTSSVYFRRTEDNYVSTSMGSGGGARAKTFRIQNNSGEIMYYIEQSNSSTTMFTIWFDENGKIKGGPSSYNSNSRDSIPDGSTHTIGDRSEAFVLFDDSTLFNKIYTFKMEQPISSKDLAHIYSQDDELGYSFTIDFYEITESISKEDLIETITLDTKAYNSNEWVSGIIYEYLGKEKQQTQGTAAGSVTSTSSSAYPQDGVQGNYWYVYTGTTTEYSQGSSNGSVTSTNRNQYPDNGRSGSYWYVYSSSSTSYSQGSYIDQVSSTNRSQYPDNNYSGSYWYVYSTSSTSNMQGSYIDQAISTERNTYPDNGTSGNYWYVYQGTSQDTISYQASMNSILSQ